MFRVPPEPAPVAGPGEGAREDIASLKELAGAIKDPARREAALQALRDQAGIKPGQAVCINGAAGGVGSAAVRIAKSSIRSASISTGTPA